MPFLFTMKGRLTRLAYTQVLTFVVLYMGTVAYLQLKFWEDLPESPVLFWAFYLLVFAPSTWAVFCATAKRLQDFTINGWFAFAVLGPALLDWQIALGLCVVAALVPSTKYDTIYGRYDMALNAKIDR